MMFLKINLAFWYENYWKFFLLKYLISAFREARLGATVEGILTQKLLPKHPGHTLNLQLKTERMN